MIYYRNPANQEVYAYDPETQKELIDQAIANGWSLVTNWPLPPSNEELLQECKYNASNLLYKTDWTTIPDVIDPTNTPYLTNQAEFIAYRNTLRQLAVNPVVDPVFPTVPTAQWSS